MDVSAAQWDHLWAVLRAMERRLGELPASPRAAPTHGPSDGDLLDWFEEQHGAVVFGACLHSVRVLPNETVRDAMRRLYALSHRREGAR